MNKQFVCRIASQIKKAIKVDLDRLEEIKDEMWRLNDEAMDILRGSTEEDRARSYWYAHIQGALDKENSQYMGGSMYDLQSAINALRKADVKIEDLLKKKNIKYELEGDTLYVEKEKLREVENIVNDYEFDLSVEDITTM
jgi:endonuclease/exonuclease/phosphatase family metal-dependent hydrolase